jgi:hypothetical protein
VVVPDTGGLARIGESTLSGKVGGRGDSSFGDGFGGLKKLGVKEMTYKVRSISARAVSLRDPLLISSHIFGVAVAFVAASNCFATHHLPTILSVVINHCCMPTR